jgi:hypothetical protein
MLDINVTLGETAAASDRALANNGASELNGCLETRYLNLRKEIEPVPSLAIVPDSYSSGVLFSQLPSHRTNFITNNTMQGAAPNVFPTGWSISTGTLTATCIGSGVENDIEYIDIQVSGTATSGFLNIRPNFTPSGILAAVNDNFCGSIYYKLVSGNFPNFPNLPNLQIQELNNVNFLLGSAVNTPATSTLTRVEVNRTMNQPTVNNVGIRWGHDATGTFNYVVRLGLPQLERGLKARDIIRTKGTLVSVYQSPTNIITQGGDFIVSRNTGATRVGPNGLIETGNTNLALQSQAFDVSGTWTPTNTTVNDNVTGTTDPAGGNTADQIFETAVSGSHFLAQTMAIVNGTTYAGSVFLKKAAGSPDWMQVAFSTTGLAGFANFNLTSGTVGLTGAGCTGRIDNYGNGWYRCTLIQTATASGTSGGPVIVFTNNTNSATRYVNYAGNTATSIYAWGAQLEAGSIASEYIPTTTVARTRFAGVTVDGTIAANIPRIDWLGQSCPALLVEPSAQNLFLQSAGFQVSGNWSPINTTVTTGSTAAFTAPDNSTDADLITATTSTSTYIGQNITIASGTYTISVFAKAGNYGLFRIGNVLSADRAAWFDLNAGVVTGTVNGGTASMQNYGNGWYRCIYTSPTMVSGNTFFAPSDAPNSTNSVIGSSIYLWGAQLETGSIATTYIPTTSGTGSRAADVISASGALVSGLIGQTEGTIYAEVDVRNLAIETYIIRIDEGASSNNITLRKLNTNQIRTAIVAPTTSGTLNISSAAFTAGIIKIAFAYKSGEIALSVNGATPLTANGTFAFGAPLNRITLGSNQSPSSEFNDRIRSAALYTTRLSNAQLQRLTSFYKPEYDNINLWNAFTQRYSNPDPCLYNRLCALLY